MFIYQQFQLEWLEASIHKEHRCIRYTCTTGHELWIIKKNLQVHVHPFIPSKYNHVHVYSHSKLICKFSNIWEVDQQIWSVHVGGSLVGIKLDAPWQSGPWLRSSSQQASFPHFRRAFLSEHGSWPELHLLGYSCLPVCTECTCTHSVLQWKRKLIHLLISYQLLHLG